MIRSRLGRVTVGNARDMQLPGTALGLRPLHCASRHVGADLTAAYSQTPHLHLLRLSVRYSRSGVSDSVSVPNSDARTPAAWQKSYNAADAL
jgi:hypothetical protein